MSTLHEYNLSVEWTGNKGSGTSSYHSYDRSHVISIENKSDIQGSSDPAFRGDKSKHNPEELFLASISSCHMLWYLHLCSVEGIHVVDYKDNAIGFMQEHDNGNGHFVKVILRPHVIVSHSLMVEKAIELHQKANEFCFIANSCNFPVYHEPDCEFVNA